MSRIVIFCSLILAFFACRNSSSLQNEAEKIISEIKQQYAPDNREAIFNIELKGNVLLGEMSSSEARLDLLAKLRESNTEFTDKTVFLPDSSVGNKCWGLITISVGNVRTSPGHDAEMATQVTLGTPVKIFKRNKGWFWIQTPDNYIGWIDQDAVAQTDQAGLTSWRQSERVIYLPDFGMGFSQADSFCVTDLVSGSILRQKGVFKKSNYLVEMPDGREFIIPINSVNAFALWSAQSEPSGVDLAKKAKLFMGRPYLWGGTSVRGMDCSGFTKTLFFQKGMILARDASLQYRHGGMIPPAGGYKQLHPGDLVFFGPTKEGVSKATHVGMYIGDSEYIHSSGFIRINSFDSARSNYSKKRFDTWLGGRRILGHQGTKGIVRVADHPWYFDLVKK